jgi:DNA-binding MarR family transcriptional regulator
MSVYEEEGQSQDSLALSRGFDKTMIAKSVVKLEGEGLICRKADPSDKRVKRLYPTAAGKNLKPELQKIGYAISRDVFTGMDDEEAAVALACLRKMAFNAAEI